MAAEVAAGVGHREAHHLGIGMQASVDPAPITRRIRGVQHQVQHHLAHGRRRHPQRRLHFGHRRELNTAVLHAGLHQRDDVVKVARLERPVFFARLRNQRRHRGANLQQPAFKQVERAFAGVF